MLSEGAGYDGPPYAVAASSHYHWVCGSFWSSIHDLMEQCCPQLADLQSILIRLSGSLSSQWIRLPKLVRVVDPPVQKFGERESRRLNSCRLAQGIIGVIKQAFITFGSEFFQDTGS